MTRNGATSAVPPVLTDPLRNHGVAFTQAERETLGLTGRLPSAVLTLDQQAQLVYRQLAAGLRRFHRQVPASCLVAVPERAAALRGLRRKLRQYCIEGTELNRDQVDAYVNRSLMLVTALSPVIGYDKASAIAHKANDEGTTLREAAIATGYVTPADFDRLVNPAAMVAQPPQAGG
jgi:hypothetical protein